MMMAGKRKGGFTLIEVLVASLLLGMLVSILTMVFNQNAIAWRTGKAGVSQLSDARRKLAFAQRKAENFIPRVEEGSSAKHGLVVSPWDAKKEPTTSGQSAPLRKRALVEFKEGGAFSLPSGFSSANFDKTAPWAEVNSLKDLRSGSEKTYIVGVLSYGPDGKPDTADDITSWPENVQ